MPMTERMKNILSGVGSVFCLFPSTNYSRFVPPSPQAQLQKAWSDAGDALRHAMGQYENDAEEIGKPATANRSPTKRRSPSVSNHAEAKKEGNVTAGSEIQARVQIRQQFEGPLPPPVALEGYERILPGAAERIMQMAERSLIHQQEISKAALAAETRESRTGQWFAFIVALSALTTGAFAIFTITQQKERPSYQPSW